MYKILTGCVLNSGEKMEIGLVDAPDEPFATSIEGLLSHKGTEWRAHIHAALQGETDELETRFYLGLVDGQPVANIMTVEYHGVGILGHVFTRPEYRRKGICKALMQALFEDFNTRSGHVLILGTGYKSVAYKIYESFGFKSIRGGFMRYSNEPNFDFEEKWFVKTAAEIVPLCWKYGPRLALLAATPGTESLRSAAWGVFGVGNLEWIGVKFMACKAAGEPVQANVLVTQTGAVAGCASLHPLRVWQDPHVWPNAWLIDVFTHPNYNDSRAELLESLALPQGRIVAYVDASAKSKATVFEECGFEKEGTLKRFLRSDGEPKDVWIYTKEGASD